MNKKNIAIAGFLIYTLVRLHGYPVTGLTLAEVSAELQDPVATATLAFYFDGYTITNFSDYTGSHPTHNCCTTATSNGGTLSYSGVISTMPDWTNIGDQNCIARNDEWAIFVGKLTTHESEHISIGQDVYEEYKDIIEGDFDGHTESACATTTPVARVTAEDFIALAASRELATIVTESNARNDNFDAEDGHAVLNASVDLMCP